MNPPPPAGQFQYSPGGTSATSNTRTFYPQPPFVTLDQQEWNIDTHSTPSSTNIGEINTAAAAANDPIQMVMAAKTAFDILSSNGSDPMKSTNYLSWIFWPMKALKPYFQDWIRKTCSESTQFGVSGSIPIQQMSSNGVSASNLGISFAVPRDDFNCPDLYIPDVLGLTASSALVTSLLELFVVRAGFFFLGLGSTMPMLEYVSYVGYKYIGLVIIVVGGLLSPISLSSIVTRILWLYFSIAYAVFALRSMKDVLNLATTTFGTASLLPGGASSTLDLSGAGSGTVQRRRVYFLLLVAVLQAIFSYYLIIEPKLVSPIGRN